MIDRVEYFRQTAKWFQRCRGRPIVLSKNDWKLIDTWHTNGIPLEAIRRGIEQAFERPVESQQSGPSKSINGLAWCSEAVLSAARALREASVGTSCRATSASHSQLTLDRVASHLTSAATLLESASTAPAVCATIAHELRELARVSSDQIDHFEKLEHSLILLEKDLLNALMDISPEDLIATMKTRATRDLRQYRDRMTAESLEKLERQWVHKHLFLHYNLPRLSLFHLIQ